MLKEWTTPDSRNTPSNTNLKEEEIVDTPGNDGNASMPEQAKRPKPWKKKKKKKKLMMMIFGIVSYLCGSKRYRQELRKIYIFVANERTLFVMQTTVSQTQGGK
jgi:hypothetical protein